MLLLLLAAMLLVERRGLWSASDAVHAVRQRFFSHTGTDVTSVVAHDTLYLSEPVTNHVVVLIFTEKYMRLAIVTLRELRLRANYSGDIVVLTTSGEQEEWLKLGLACNNRSYLEKYMIQEEQKNPGLCAGGLRWNVQVVGMPPFNLTALSAFHNSRPKFKKGDGRYRTKTFQWFKMRVFEPYFRKWDRVLYMDAGFHVRGSLDELWRLDTQQSLVAPLDDPRLVWKLIGQIEEKCCPDIIRDLRSVVPDLNIDYFQTGALLFSTTDLIDPTGQTVRELETLMNRWPIMVTNEQALMNIYFNAMLDRWVPFQYYHRLQEATLYQYCANSDGRAPPDRIPTLLWKNKC